MSIQSIGGLIQLFFFFLHFSFISDFFHWGSQEKSKTNKSHQEATHTFPRLKVTFTQPFIFIYTSVWKVFLLFVILCFYLWKILLSLQKRLCLFCKKILLPLLKQCIFSFCKDRLYCTRDIMVVKGNQEDEPAMVISEVWGSTENFKIY